MDGDLVLDAVEPFGHAVIKRRGLAPADRGTQDDHVSPIHEALVHRGELVGGIPFRDGAGPGAGVCRLRVVPLTGAEVQVR